MTTKNKRSGRSLLGTLFLASIFFWSGVYHKEIRSFVTNTVQSISH